MTHREFLRRVAWEEEQLNKPSPSDYYMMAIAKEVHDLAQRVWGKKPTSKQEQFMIEFKRAKQQTEDEKRAAYIAREKAIWGRRLRGK